MWAGRSLKGGGKAAKMLISPLSFSQWVKYGQCLSMLWMLWMPFRRGICLKFRLGTDNHRHCDGICAFGLGWHVIQIRARKQCICLPRVPAYPVFRRVPDPGAVRWTTRLLTYSLWPMEQYLLLHSNNLSKWHAKRHLLHIWVSQQRSWCGNMPRRPTRGLWRVLWPHQRPIPDSQHHEASEQPQLVHRAHQFFGHLCRTDPMQSVDTVECWFE